MAAVAPRDRQSTVPRQLVVHAYQDHRKGGWWAESDDIPGLVTEAETFAELVDRVAAIFPELCSGNNVAISGGDVVRIQPEKGPPAMTPEELNQALSRLGDRLWDALRNDDYVADLLNDLAEAKLAIDGVHRNELDLTEEAALAIFNDSDPGHPQIIRPKEFVESREWAKNSLYNLALHWVLDQGLARMKIEHTFPSDVGKSDP